MSALDALISSSEGLSLAPDNARVRIPALKAPITIQSECCAGHFPNSAALVNHRTLSDVYHNHYYFLSPPTQTTVATTVPVPK
eukprot:scaffold381292_cov54-Attheya_sp.AAC.1